MSSRKKTNLNERLKEAVISKNNITKIYKNINNGVPMNIGKADKVALSNRIVAEISKTYGTVSFSKLSASNFDQVVNGINKKTIINVNKFITAAQNSSQGQHTNQRARDLEEHPDYESRHDHDRIDETSRPDYSRRRDRDEYVADFVSEDAQYESDSDESMGEKIKRMESERYSSLSKGNQRPPEIDFSLEPKSKKQMHEESKRKAKAKFDKYQRSKGVKPVKKKGGLDDFYAPISDVNQMDGEDELEAVYSSRITNKYIDEHDVEHDAMLDPFENNVDNYTTGIDPDEYEYDDKTSLDEQMKQYEYERDNDGSQKPNPGQRQKQIRQPTRKPTEHFDQEQYDEPRQRQPDPRQRRPQVDPRQRQPDPRQRRPQMDPRQRQPDPRQRQPHYDPRQHQSDPYNQHQVPHHDPYIGDYNQPPGPARYDPNSGKRVQFAPDQYSQPYVPEPYEQPTNQIVNDAIHKHTMQYQSEIAALKNQLATITPTEQGNQVKLLNNELKNANTTIIALRERAKVGRSTEELSGDKLKDIALKRNEIIQQMGNLKEKLAETESLIHDEKLLKASIDEKHNEVRTMIEKNLSLYNNSEKNVIINTETCIKNAQVYTHTFDSPISVLTSLEINDYSFPSMLHNITPYNNTLYIIMDGNPSITCDDLITYTKTKNVHQITISPGNYEIDYLIQLLSNILKQMSLKIQLKQANNYISIFSDTCDFSLMTDYANYKNNILSVFGFENGARCLNDKNFISTMSCDLRSDKTVLLYLLNINRSQAFCKLNMTSRKVTSFCTQLSPPLSHVDRLDVEFRDSIGNPMHFAGKHVMLDFTIKSLETQIPQTKTEAVNEVSSVDLYDQISNLMQT